MLNRLGKNWFFLGLIVMTVLTLADERGLVAACGKWLKDHRGPDGAICLIFFLSGMLLDLEEIRSGLRDVKGTLVTLGIILIVAPLLALMIDLFPLGPDLRIGLFLVAVMPTTLKG